MTEYLYNSKLKTIVERGLDERGSVEFEPESREGRINIFTAWFWKMVSKRYSHHKNIQNATLGKWRVHVKEALEEDDRTLTGLKKVVKFACQDDFWRNKILSTEGLRRNYATAYDEMMRQAAKAEKKREMPPVQRANAGAYQYVG